MVAAVLHFARDVLIPLALAVLLAFLLAPAARRLERLHLGRLASTLGVVALGFAVIGAVGWVAGNQTLSLAENLPLYMLPDAFSWHEQLPKTSTDKIDYQRLKSVA